MHSPGARGPALTAWITSTVGFSKVRGPAGRACWAEAVAAKATKRAVLRNIPVGLWVGGVGEGWGGAGACPCHCRALGSLAWPPFVWAKEAREAGGRKERGKEGSRDGPAHVVRVGKRWVGREEETRGCSTPQEQKDTPTRKGEGWGGGHGGKGSEVRGEQKGEGRDSETYATSATSPRRRRMRPDWGGKGGRSRHTPLLFIITHPPTPYKHRAEDRAQETTATTTTTTHSPVQEPRVHKGCSK